MSADGTDSPRRSPRASDGGAPVSGALAIVLAVIAVVAGFLILRSIGNDDPTSAGGGDAGQATTTLDPTVTTVPIATTTTAPLFVAEGAIVIVANASSVNGSAGQMTRALEAAGYTMGAAANSTEGTLDTTKIYFDPANDAAEAVASSVGRSLGSGVAIAVLPDPVPTDVGSMGDATVLVVLGVDKAGRTLEELNPAATTAAVEPPAAEETTTTALAG